MTCILTSGIARGCRDNRPGIKRALIANIDNITSYTEAEGLISAFTTGSVTPFFEFIPTKQSSNADAEGQFDSSTGAAGYNHMVNLTFAKKDVAKRNTLQLMGEADLVAIIQDFNGSYWYYGAFNGLEVSTMTDVTGVTGTDLNGYTVTLSGEQDELPYQVTGSIIDGLYA